MGPLSLSSYISFSHGSVPFSGKNCLPKIEIPRKGFTIGSSVAKSPKFFTEGNRDVLASCFDGSVSYRPSFEEFMQTVMKESLVLYPIPLNFEGRKLYASRMPAVSELERLKDKGIKTVFPMVSRIEAYVANGKSDLFDNYVKEDIDVAYHPIEASWIPSVPNYRAVVGEVMQSLGVEENVLVHCCKGRGRTGLVIAGVMLAAEKLEGVEELSSVEDVINRLRESLPDAVESRIQVQMLVHFRKWLHDNPVDEVRTKLGVCV